MKKSKKIVLLLLVLIIIGCAAYVIYYYVHKQQKEGIYEEIQQEVVVDVEPQEETEEIQIPIDFAALQQQNPDAYAWIQIAGTNINYPILQSETDNSYYLNHNIDGSEGYPGCLYTENWNSKVFTDFNTVIYGHEMRDGSMFHDLMNYDDINYMNEHSNVVIYTPEKILTYKVFAYVEYDDRHILHSYEFAFPDERQAFLDSLHTSRSLGNVFREDVTVTTDSRILTMSTCMPGVDDGRILVEAVLVNEEQ